MKRAEIIKADDKYIIKVLDDETLTDALEADEIALSPEIYGEILAPAKGRS